MSAMGPALRKMVQGTIFGYGAEDTAGHCFSATNAYRILLRDVLITLVRRSDGDDAEISDAVIPPLLPDQSVMRSWNNPPYQETYTLADQPRLAELARNNGWRLKGALETGEFHYTIMLLRSENLFNEEGVELFSQLEPRFDSVRGGLSRIGEQENAGDEENFLPMAPSFEFGTFAARYCSVNSYGYLRRTVVAARDLTEFLLNCDGFTRFVTGTIAHPSAKRCRCRPGRFRWRKVRRTEDQVFYSGLRAVDDPESF